MRVILNAGMHKSGTTSLQRDVRGKAGPADRGDRLSGTAPSGLAARHGRLLGVRPSTWSPQTCRSLVERVEADGMEAVILSGKVASTLSAPELERLVDAFRPWPVDLAVCLRRWSGVLPSLWG